MALDSSINQIKGNNYEVSTPATQNTGAGGTANVNKVSIDWSKLPTADNPESIEQLVNFINTLDKDLNPADVLKAVREQFNVSIAITDTQLKEYINTAKQLFALSNPDVSVESQDDDESDRVVTDKIELLAAQYLKENPDIPDDIDAILVSLKQQKPEELSATAKQLLAELDSGNKQYKNVDPNADVTEDLESEKLTEENYVVSPKVLYSKEFKNKRSKEKFEYIMDQYLVKNDPEYQKLTDEKDKKAYLKSKQDELVSILLKLYPDLKDSDMKSLTAKGMLLLQASQLEGKPLSEYKAYSKDQLEGVMNTTLQKVISSTADPAVMGELKNMAPKEKLNTMLDNFLSVCSSKYSSLSDSRKEKFRQGVIKQFLQAMGIPHSEIANGNISEKNLEMIVGYLEMKMQEVKSGQTSLFELAEGFSNRQAVSMDFLNYIEQKYLNDSDSPLPEDEKKRLSNHINNTRNLDKALCEISKALNKNIKDLTAQECKDWLAKQKAANGVLPKEFEYLEKILVSFETVNPELLKEFGLLDSLHKAMNSSSLKRALTEGVKQEEIWEKDAQRLAQDIGNKELADEISKLYLGDSYGFEKFCLKLKAIAGLDDAQIKELFPDAKHRAIRFGAGRASGNGKESASAYNNMANLGTDKEKILVKKLLEDYGPGVPDNEVSDFIVGMYSDSNSRAEFGFSATVALNKNYDAKVVADAGKALADSDEVSDTAKAAFSRDIVETASADRQEYYGRELSKTGNEAVLEGLAAASNNVDPSVRSQYNSYVSTAASQCSPEAQARINTAMQTGEISEQTRNSTVTTPQVEQDFRTHETGKTSVNEISTPVVTKPTVNVNYDVVTSALKNKKEVLAEKITSISEEIKTEVREREEVVTQEVVDELDEIIGAVEEGTVTDDMQSKLKVIIETEDLVGLYTKLSSIKGGGILKQFIAALTSYATHHQVLSFATSLRADSGLMEELFHQASGALQEKLIKAGILSESLVYKLLENGALSTLDGIDGKLIYRFVLDHLHDIGINGLAKYWAYIPWEKQQELLTKLNEMRGVTVETSSVEEDGRTEVNDKPQELAQVNSTTLQTSTTDNNMPEGGKVGQKDKSDSTPVSMNPELDSPDDMFSNPLLKKDKVEGDSPDGKKTRLQIQEETGYTYIQQQRNAGVIYGSDDWAKLDKQAKNYKPLAYEPSQDDNDGFSGILGGKQVPHWKRLNKFNLKF